MRGSYHLRPKHSERPLTASAEEVTQSAANPSRNQNWTLRKVEAGKSKAPAFPTALVKTENPLRKN